MEKYIPSEEEMRVAEESLTPEQKLQSEAREEGYHLGRADLDAEWQREKAESVGTLELSTSRLTNGFRVAMQEAGITTREQLTARMHDGTIANMKGVGPAMRTELAELLKTK